MKLGSQFDASLLFSPDITAYEKKVVMDALGSEARKQPYEYIEKFERDFAAYIGRRYALMTPNGTSAIHLALLGLGIRERQEVLVPECTWIGTSAPVSYVRATPVFCDVEASTWCLSAATVLPKISSATRAVIAVGLYGNLPDYDALERTCRQRGLYLIEDAAESLGSVFRKRRSGQFGIASTFSFHRTKTIATGEGGMLVTDSKKLYERCRFLRDHGRSRRKTYHILEVAYKYIPSNLQAALGWAQLQKIDATIQKKRQILAWYRNYLQAVPDIAFNMDNAEIFNGCWASSLAWDTSWRLSKNEVMRKLQAQGLPARPFFAPLSSMPAYRHLKQKKYQQLNPVAYELAARGINLPSSTLLKKKDVERYARGLLTVFKPLKVART